MMPTTIPQWKAHRGLLLLGVVALVFVECAARADAQQQLPPPQGAVLQPPLPRAPDEKRIPMQDSIIAPISVNDQYFEVLVGQSRIVTTKVELRPKGIIAPLVAVGDPGILDFNVLNSSQIRVVGLLPGVTDLSIVTADKVTHNIEIRVKSDLAPLRARIAKSFPDASVRMTEMRDHVLVEGQARDTAQVARIIETIRAYLESVVAAQTRKVTGQTMPGVVNPKDGPMPIVAPPQTLKVEAKFAQPQIINLLKVPGPQQVLLKVQVAELNRTALREIGADLLFANPNGSSLVGTQIGGANVLGKATGAGGIFTDAASMFSTSATTTVFGIFEKEFAFMLRALRKNQLLKILAEPNLVALNGHKASFLAGGEFPVPVPQTGAQVGSVTIEWKKFGVELGFKPDILDNNMIRLAVSPSVSSLDFTIGTTIQGTAVPGLNVRDANTTVELREGQTLAIAGLLQLTLEGQSGRIPGIGDLPILGAFFSNTTSNRVEKELIVLVTPYLVNSMNCDQVPPLPGAEVGGPNDLEFYLHNRIEGRLGDWRATTGNYASAPALMPAYLRLHDTYVRGPHGFSE